MKELRVRINLMIITIDHMLSLLLHGCCYCCLMVIRRGGSRAIARRSFDSLTSTFFVVAISRLDLPFVPLCSLSRQRFQIDELSFASETEADRVVSEEHKNIHNMIMAIIVSCWSWGGGGDDDDVSDCRADDEVGYGDGDDDLGYSDGVNDDGGDGNNSSYIHS